jgi:hypothetical protein
MLCDNCKERTAHRFITTIVNGVSATKRLCPECANTLSPESAEMNEAMRSGCEYCGAEVCGGGTDFLEFMATGVQKMRMLCRPCLMERSRYTKPALQQAVGLPLNEFRAIVRKVNVEADAHMKEWVLVFAAQLREAHCFYCGGTPCTTTNGLAFVADAGFEFMCKRCAEEQHRYIQHTGMEDKEKPGQELEAQIRSLAQDVAQHMQQWVSERKDLHSRVIPEVS